MADDTLLNKVYSDGTILSSNFIDDKQNWASEKEEVHPRSSKQEVEK